MANIKSVIKRARQSIKLRSRNVAARSTYRTSIKTVLKAIELGDKTAATAAYQKAQPIIDKAARKGLMHKNKAARIKSRLVVRLKAMVSK